MERYSFDRPPSMLIVGIGEIGAQAINHAVKSGVSAEMTTVLVADRPEKDRSQAGSAIFIGDYFLTNGDSTRNENLSDVLKKTIGQADIVVVLAEFNCLTEIVMIKAVLSVVREMNRFSIVIGALPARNQDDESGELGMLAMDDAFEESDFVIVIDSSEQDGSIHEDGESGAIISMVRSLKHLLLMLDETAASPIGHQRLGHVLQGMGHGLVGHGAASGADRAGIAARRALEDLAKRKEMLPMDRALFSVIGGDSLTLGEMEQVALALAQAGIAVDEIDFSMHVDLSLKEEMQVHILAAKRRRL